MLNDCFPNVNSQIFARVLFSQNFAYHMQSLVKIKSSWNAEITLLFTDICKSCPSREFLASQTCLLTLIIEKIYGFTYDMSFNAIRDNKIIAKISGFTIFLLKNMTLLFQNRTIKPRTGCNSPLYAPLRLGIRYISFTQGNHGFCKSLCKTATQK